MRFRCMIAIWSKFEKMTVISNRSFYITFMSVNSRLAVVGDGEVRAKSDCRLIISDGTNHITFVFAKTSASKIGDSILWVEVYDMREVLDGTIYVAGRLSSKPSLL